MCAGTTWRISGTACPRHGVRPCGTTTPRSACAQSDVSGELLPPDSFHGGCAGFSIYAACAPPGIPPGIVHPGYSAGRARGLFHLKNHNRKEYMMKLDINDSIEVKSRAEYRRLLQGWASQTGSRPVYEYDGPGAYRPEGWYDDRNCACCTLGRKN